MKRSFSFAAAKIWNSQDNNNNNKSGLLTYFSTFRELQYVYNLNLPIKVFTN